VRSLAVAAAAACLGALSSGCALPVEGEMDRMSDIARFATSYDHVVDARANLIDRALADCPEKTVKAETACLRQGIDAAKPAVKVLMALVPGCRAGQVCHYDHTTRDRLGFVRASATDYVKRWRVDLDFTHPAPAAAQVPVTVIDREDFDSAPAAPAKPG
jgi:hypothetical protein